MIDVDWFGSVTGDSFIDQLAGEVASSLCLMLAKNSRLTLRRRSLVRSGVRLIDRLGSSLRVLLLATGHLCALIW